MRARLAVRRVVGTVVRPVRRIGGHVVAGVEHLVRGDRPLVAALIAVLVLGALVLSGPAQSYFDGRERVRVLEIQARALEEANATLERRVGDLNDPERIELLAREQQGFVRPGEVAYSLVPPEVERPRITAARGAPEAAPDPWYARAFGSVVEWLRG